MATHSNVLAWRIPGTGEPGGLPSMGLQSRTRLKRLSSNSQDFPGKYDQWRFLLFGWSHLSAQPNHKAENPSWIHLEGIFKITFNLLFFFWLWNQCRHSSKGWVFEILTGYKVTDTLGNCSWPQASCGFCNKWPPSCLGWPLLLRGFAWILFLQAAGGHHFDYKLKLSRKFCVLYLP